MDEQSVTVEWGVVTIKSTTWRQRLADGDMTKNKMRVEGRLYTQCLVKIKPLTVIVGLLLGWW